MSWKVPGYLAECQKDFLERLRVRMERRGIRQLDLANRLGVAPCYISRIFSSRSELRLSTMGAIADALEMRIDIKVKELRRGRPAGRLCLSGTCDK